MSKKILSDHINESQKKGHGDYTYDEINQKMCRGILEELMRFATEETKKYDGDFYIQQVTETARGTNRTVKNVSISRNTCPSPDFDQVVYKYKKKDDVLELLWVVPEKQVAYYILSGLDTGDLDPDVYDLVEYVVDFATGELNKKCLEYNNIKSEDVYKRYEDFLNSKSLIK